MFYHKQIHPWRCYNPLLLFLACFIPVYSFHFPLFPVGARGSNPGASGCLGLGLKALNFSLELSLKSSLCWLQKLIWSVLMGASADYLRRVFPAVASSAVADKWQITIPWSRISSTQTLKTILVIFIQLSHPGRLTYFYSQGSLLFVFNKSSFFNPHTNPIQAVVYKALNKENE